MRWRLRQPVMARHFSHDFAITGNVSQDLLRWFLLSCELPLASAPLFGIGGSQGSGGNHQNRLRKAIYSTMPWMLVSSARFPGAAGSGSTCMQSASLIVSLSGQRAPEHLSKSWDQR